MPTVDRDGDLTIEGRAPLPAASEKNCCGGQSSDIQRHGRNSDTAAGRSRARATGGDLQLQMQDFGPSFQLRIIFQDSALRSKLRRFDDLIQIDGQADQVASIFARNV
jgi:hypothetical protein